MSVHYDFSCRATTGGGGGDTVLLLAPETTALCFFWSKNNRDFRSFGCDVGVFMKNWGVLDECWPGKTRAPCFPCSRGKRSPLHTKKQQRQLTASTKEGKGEEKQKKSDSIFDRFGRGRRVVVGSRCARKNSASSKRKGKLITPPGVPPTPRSQFHLTLKAPHNHVPSPSIHFFVFIHRRIIKLNSRFFFMYLGLREQDGVYVENITEEKVQSEAAVLGLLARGSAVRSKGETQVTDDRLPCHPLA